MSSADTVIWGKYTLYSANAMIEGNLNHLLLLLRYRKGNGDTMDNEKRTENKRKEERIHK
jgi:hypothetical protein